MSNIIIFYIIILSLGIVNFIYGVLAYSIINGIIGSYIILFMLLIIAIDYNNIYRGDKKDVNEK